MAACPHCQANIESLPGFIPQADLETRINTLKQGKDAEISALSTRLGEAQTKAGGYDAIVLERDGLKQQVESRTLKDSRTTLLTGRKVDVSLLESFEQVYSWSQNGAVEADKKSFEDWFAADADKHILLADKFDAPAPPPPNPEAGDGINKLPPPGAGGAGDPPPPSNGKVTNEDVSAFFASAAYQALPVKERKAKLEQFKRTGTTG